MKILAIDTTGKACSAAISESETVLCEAYTNVGLKHSQTLMPMVEEVLDRASLTIRDIELFAVTVGPGSFTGVRIGICTVKALAQFSKKPVAAVDTLDALAENCAGFDGTVCAMLDARRGEVYGAAYEGGRRIMEDMAAPLETVLEKLPKGRAIFLGDGAQELREKILLYCPEALFAPAQFMQQRAASVCVCAAKMAENGQLSEYQALSARYLRESQAQRVKRERAHK